MQITANCQDNIAVLRKKGGLLLGDRIKESRKNAGFSTQKSFAEALGIGARTLADYEGDATEPSASLIVKIAKICNVPPLWLLTGESETSNLPIATEHEDDSGTVSLKYFPDVSAAAGYGSINDYDDHYQIMKFDRAFLQEILNVRRFDKLDIIRIVGDSMEPFIHDGETVLVERCKDARNGETVIANVNGHIYVKRYHTHPFGKWVKLISDNRLYGDIELEGEDLEHFSLIGIVRARIKSF